MKAPGHIQQWMNEYQDAFNLQMQDLEILEQMRKKKQTKDLKRGIRALERTLSARSSMMRTIDSDIFNFSLREITSELYNVNKTA